MAMPFRFRQFTVEDRNSTMRVGTDSMVLGSFLDPGESRFILDAGTGCGVLALMAAQRSDAIIHAIDTHAGSAGEAAANFRNSPWGSRLLAFHRSLRDHVALATVKYDIIICNPPFFSDDLPSPAPVRALARHMDYDEVGVFTRDLSLLLQQEGIIVMILPNSRTVVWEKEFRIQDLYPEKKVNIIPKTGKPANRTIVTFRRIKTERPVIRELTIRTYDDTFTREYLELTGEFHLFPEE
jgi:tRNA1Val (adenine37-N6)-methyltransferase